VDQLVEEDLLGYFRNDGFTTHRLLLFFDRDSASRSPSETIGKFKDLDVLVIGTNSDQMSDVNTIWCLMVTAKTRFDEMKEIIHSLGIF
jgi:hypothetical protein